MRLCSYAESLYDEWTEEAAGRESHVVLLVDRIDPFPQTEKSTTNMDPIRAKAHKTDAENVSRTRAAVLELEA